MFINGYRLYRATLGCLRPFRIATGLQENCEILLVELLTDTGHVGYGEAVPIPLLTDENLVGCEWTLQEVLLPLLQGKDPWCLREIHNDMLSLTRSKSARCAIDVAVHNLQAQCAGVSLSRLLGAPRTRYETNYSIGICSLEETVSLARQFYEAGYHKIKIKVGLEPDYDVERVVKLNETLPAEVQFRLDANCGWTRHQALQVLRRCQEHRCRIEFVEQPVAREDFEGMRFIRERVEYPIAADESVQNAEDALHLLEGRCVDILNIKLMKTGGLLPALKVVHLARAFRCQMMIGGMVGESEISVMAAASLAASLDFEYADLDADILLREGPFEGHGAGTGHLGLEAPHRVWSDEGAVKYPGLASERVKLVHQWHR